MTSQQWFPLQTRAGGLGASNKTGFGAGYTEVQTDEGIPIKHVQTSQQRYTSGIKRTLRLFLLAACAVFITNVTWLAYAKAKYGIEDRTGTIRRGECSSVKDMNTWIHFAINILSTLLLTGSNSFMAAFASPSRDEIDKAHQRGKNLQVGTLSFGNLRRIAKRKGLVVLVLAASSIPFHLLYNSLVFTTLSMNQYYWTVTSEDFLNGAHFNLTGNWIPVYSAYNDSGTRPFFNASQPKSGYISPFDSSTYLTLEKNMDDYFKNIQKSAPTWERLDNKACIEAYSSVFMSSRRNVVLISSSANTNNNSILQYGAADASNNMDGNWWICSMSGQANGHTSCNPQDYTSSANSWEVEGFPIDYCLSESVQDVCSIQFSVTIMIVVVAFNALKVLVMIWVLVRFEVEHLIPSIGDAAASFLLREDQYTMQMCLASKRQMRSFWRQRGFARTFTRRRQFWGFAVSKRRWILFFFLCAFALSVVFFFGVWGFIHAKNRGISLDPASLWRLGFGAMNENTMVLYASGEGNAVTMSIIANIPQLFLSPIYLVYMGIMSSMFLAADWSKFAFKAQSLMTSGPVGKQRGTWLLGAPIGWGLALFGLQTLLHWFVSQALFVVQITIYNKDGTPRERDSQEYVDFSHISNCGYSPIAIIFAVLASIVLILSAIVFLWRRFPEGSPPVVSTCSAAISAACHPMTRTDDMIYQELRWGANGGFSNGIGHCSLVPAVAWDSGQASEPVEGYTYAGLPEK